MMLSEHTKKPKTIEKKINNIFTLMKLLVKGEELYPQNEKLQRNLDVDERTLRRYLEDIYELYGHIVLIEKEKKPFTQRKVTMYRLSKTKGSVSKAFNSFVKDSDELPELLLSSGSQNAYLFKTPLFGDVEKNGKKSKFLEIKDAVEHYLYKDIIYEDHVVEKILNAKCLKMVFSDGEWYLAISAGGDLRMLRLSYIKELSGGGNKYNTAQVKRELSEIDLMQNAMTLPRTIEAVAKLKALPSIAHHFKPPCEPFFQSQKLICENEDGSIEFTIDYTRADEIFPFIKRWIPELVIISPAPLVEIYKAQLRQVLERLSV